MTVLQVKMLASKLDQALDLIQTVRSYPEKFTPEELATMDKALKDFGIMSRELRDIGQ